MSVVDKLQTYSRLRDGLLRAVFLGLCWMPLSAHADGVCSDRMEQQLAGMVGDAAHRELVALVPRTWLQDGAVHNVSLSRLLGADEAPCFKTTDVVFWKVTTQEAESRVEQLYAFWWDEDDWQVILDFTLSRTSKEYGGFSALDGLVIQPPAPTGESALARLIAQVTSLPGKNDSPFMPGPPQEVSLAFDEEMRRYELVQ